MSRLIILTRPALALGFQLAGVETFAAENGAAAQQLIASWLAAGEVGLLAVEEGLLAELEPAFRRRLETAEDLLCLALPSGEPLGPAASHRGQMAELIRQAIGFHITFREEATP